MENIEQVFKELEEKFEKIVGIKADESLPKDATTEQTIEYYTRQLAFWNQIGLENNDETNYMANIAKKELLTKIEEIYDPLTQEKIQDRAKLLSSTDYQDKINETRIKLDQINKKSWELYEACKDEKIPTPAIWIENQDEMRKVCEGFGKDLKKSKDIFAKYMYWMYNSYPVGYGEKLKEAYQTKVGDHAEIYYSLTE